MNFTTKTLDELPLFVDATVKQFLNDSIKEKMLEMGCLPGMKITINRIAPLGDPIIISFEESQLALRKDEAKFISVSLDS
ncbi:ferrous iron transport protein A [Flavobacteriales bacterium]|nr:ferrous iron transport protein A [Flavobacteriales bacterium]